jgi:hypothetical protein
MATLDIDLDAARTTPNTTPVPRTRKDMITPPPRPTESQFYELIRLARNALYCSDRKFCMFHLNQAASAYANMPVGVQEVVAADNPSIPMPLGDWGTPDWQAYWLVRIIQKEGAFPVWHLPETGEHCPRHSTAIHER